MALLPLLLIILLRETTVLPLPMPIPARHPAASMLPNLLLSMLLVEEARYPAMAATMVRLRQRPAAVLLHIVIHGATALLPQPTMALLAAPIRLPLRILKALQPLVHLQ